MAGIVAAGAYVPLWRLDLGVLGGGARGERAIANFDEDSLTMGVAAGINCLGGTDRSTIDCLFFASSISPYKEKQISVIAAKALDLRDNILTADFANSLRAGTTALKLAADAVEAGSARQIMVIAADSRLPMPGSDFDSLLGDGAAAFIIGKENVRLNIKDSYAISDEILDLWRTDQDKYVRSWEGRFTLDEGYFLVLPGAVSTVLKRNNLTAKEMNKAVFCGPDDRRHREMARKLGFEAAQVQAPLFGSMGDTGTAFTLMLLAAALEEVKPGDRVLLANYGSGADAFLLEGVRRFETNGGIKGLIDSKRVLKDYVPYLRWRGLVEMVTGRRRPPTLSPSASSIWRERDKNLALCGVRCLECGIPQWPPQHVCCNCHAAEKFEPYRFSDKKAKLYTYSIDEMTPTLDPPYVIAVVDFEGGGRIWLSMTDKDEKEFKLEMPVALTFRKLFTQDGIHDYFWKCIPERV